MLICLSIQIVKETLTTTSKEWEEIKNKREVIETWSIWFTILQNIRKSYQDGVYGT